MATVNEMRQDMHDKLKVIHHRVDEILEQVKRTNGRVSRLEEWKSQVSGGAKVTLLLASLFAFALKIGWIAIT